METGDLAQTLENLKKFNIDAMKEAPVPSFRRNIHRPDRAKTPSFLANMFSKSEEIDKKSKTFNEFIKRTRRRFSNPKGSDYNSTHQFKREKVNETLYHISNIGDKDEKIYVSKELSSTKREFKKKPFLQKISRKANKKKGRIMDDSHNRFYMEDASYDLAQVINSANIIPKGVNMGGMTKIMGNSGLKFAKLKIETEKLQNPSFFKKPNKTATYTSNMSRRIYAPKVVSRVDNIIENHD